MRIFQQNYQKKLKMLYRVPWAWLSTHQKVTVCFLTNLTNCLLYKSQYGFRILHSSELAALEFTGRIDKKMDAKKIPLFILRIYPRRLTTAIIKGY